jgi:hypothetical protein
MRVGDKVVHDLLTGTVGVSTAFGTSHGQFAVDKRYSWYCGRRRNKRYDSTGLLSNTEYIAAYIQGLYTVYISWFDRQPGV